jgi:hypothetical protein
MIGKINEAVLAMQVWLDEERGIKDGEKIIQDRLIYAATNLAPLLALRSRWTLQLSAAHTLVKEWRRAFEKEQESSRIQQAKTSREQAAKKQRTSADSTAPEERCAAVKAWPGQEGVAGAIPLLADEIVFLLRDESDGWSKVRRESDGTEGLVPSKRLRKAPLPPAPPPPEDEEEEMEAAPAPPPAPELSDDDEADAEARAEANEREVADAAFVEATHADELARMEADAAECGFGGD